MSILRVDLYKHKQYYLMKRSAGFLAAALLLSGYMAKAQDFEGKITYKMTYASHNPGVSSAKLAAALGDKEEYYIRGSQYKSLTNGTVLSMELYDDKANKIYNKLPKSDTLYWIDAAVNSDQPTGSEIRSNADTVLGKPCDALVLKNRSGSATFYYNSQYKADASKYSKHQYGNWAILLEKTGCLPLKSVIVNGPFEITMTAVEISPQTLDAAMFSIPAGTPIQASMY